MDDQYVTLEEAKAALARLRNAQHLSVDRYRDIVYCIQHLMGNPGETPAPAPAPAPAPPPAPVEPPPPPRPISLAVEQGLAEQIREMVSNTIKTALEEQPACEACKQPLPEPEPEVAPEPEPEVAPEPEPEVAENVSPAEVIFEPAAEPAATGTAGAYAAELEYEGDAAEVTPADMWEEEA